MPCAPQLSSLSLLLDAQNQQAIKYARTVWKVDIITIASGFNQPHQLMQEEIRKACHQEILIFAAVSNDGNT